MLKETKIFFFFSILFLMAGSINGQDIYQTRIAQLKSQTELSYREEVKVFIDEYLAHPEKTKELIGLSRFYFPLFEKNLKAKNAPIDLKYLALVLNILNL